jgi:hypothetical protein
MPQPDELKKLSDALLAHVPEHGLVARVLVVAASDDASGNVAVSSNVSVEYAVQLAEAARFVLSQQCGSDDDCAASILRAFDAANGHHRLCSEHWVRTQFLPALAREGLTIVGHGSV